MRTYIFKDYLNDKHGKFLPLQTVESKEFGRHFFIDIAFEFITAPSLKGGGYDESQLEYVGNWTDLEGLNLCKLLEIYKDLTWKENNDNKEKAHSDMCEYMEAVENGEVTYL
jgi:hypothetical protein|tara:strand:+ start:988 stop:1323 length:336 start_codon:yes stop_codon:yes gene_type:complete